MERVAAEQKLSAIADLVDLQRYPVHDLASDRGHELVAACQASLNSAAACRLDGFVTPQAIERMAEEARQLVDQAYRQDDVHNVYFEDIDTSLLDDDRRRLLQHTSQAAIAWDLTPADSAVRRLYEWDGLTEFIAAALEKDRLFRSADPPGRLPYGELRGLAGCHAARTVVGSIR